VTQRLAATAKDIGDLGKRLITPSSRCRAST